MISLLAGKPSPLMFPFTSISFTVASPDRPGEEDTLKLSGEELEAGLQYGATPGQSQLIDWLCRLQEVSHGRKRNDGWALAVGVGSQDLIYKAKYFYPLLGSGLAA
jgi:tryptophan aminotransferase